MTSRRWSITIKPVEEADRKEMRKMKIYDLKTGK